MLSIPYALDGIEESLAAAESHPPWRVRPPGMNDVPKPGYDRAQVSTGVVHFGVGGFHRAHEALFHDRLMNDGKALDWGICGVGVMPADEKMRDVMRAQDGLYTLVEKHADGSLDARVIGSITEYLFAPDDPEAVIEKLADPATRIVSLTVTEGGYNLDDGTGEFVEDDPDVVHDLEPDATPKTVFGLVTEALRRRREREIVPFTVMSCDNLQGNGTLARTAFTSFARLRDPELGDWIEREVALPERHGRPHHAGDDRRGHRRRSTSASTSRTAGRWSASRSSSGCSRTPSRPGGRPTRTSACRSSTTSSRTS